MRCEDQSWRCAVPQGRLSARRAHDPDVDTSSSSHLRTARDALQPACVRVARGTARDGVSQARQFERPQHRSTFARCTRDGVARLAHRQSGRTICSRRSHRTDVLVAIRPNGKHEILDTAGIALRLAARRYVRCSVPEASAKYANHLQQHGLAGTIRTTSAALPRPSANSHLPHEVVIENQ